MTRQLIVLNDAPEDVGVATSAGADGEIVVHIYPLVGGDDDGDEEIEAGPAPRAGRVWDLRERSSESFIRADRAN